MTPLAKKLHRIGLILIGFIIAYTLGLMIWNFIGLMDFPDGGGFLAIFAFTPRVVWLVFLLWLAWKLPRGGGILLVGLAVIGLILNSNIYGIGLARASTLYCIVLTMVQTAPGFTSILLNVCMFLSGLLLLIAKSKNPRFHQTTPDDVIALPG